MTFFFFFFGEKVVGTTNVKSIQFYLSSIASGVVAQSPEPGAHVLNARAFRIELEFRNVANVHYPSNASGPERHAPCLIVYPN